ncbi:MAG: proline--tRNA ligase [Clostridia bacterium]|nr:proline--tRNA ligase [Clostridia bacterium]
MRMTQLFAPTLREVPSEAEIPSHQLMLRAGLMRKTLSGVYSYLNLGWRVVFKVENIVRQEMDRQGAQEVLMPAVQAADLWRETGRWDDYGPEMFRLRDRGGREICLGPTHEEITTVTVRDEIRSYRQLPKLLYQIQTKFRDEIRPRYGVMRAREFIMKDCYSFDRDEAGLDVSYRKMYEAYCRAFDRCGLHYKVVEADSGAIGGSQNHEFMVVSEVGEADLVFCNSCGYAANTERAESVPADKARRVAEAAEAGRGASGCQGSHARVVSTPGVHTVDELSSFLGVKPSGILKSLVYTADGEPFIAVVRGDRDANEAKLKRAVGAHELELAGSELIQGITGAPVGFAGPVGLAKKVRIVADWEAIAVASGVAGANAADAHMTGVEYGVDYVADVISDIRVVSRGDACPRCGNALDGARGVEVGHVFKLGAKYSEVLGARYLNEFGDERTMLMGCYGIGVTRTVAAVIEEHHDERGIIWPMSVAPYQAIVLPVNSSEPAQAQAAEAVYAELLECGVEAVLDDRDERPGVKFKDADLIGFPVKVTVGQKRLANGNVEISMRRGGDIELVELTRAAARIKEIVDCELAAYTPRKGVGLGARDSDSPCV